MNKKIMGLDLGSRSCGIATSDELGIIAQGRENFRFKEKNWQILFDHLEENYFGKIKLIVLGLPLLPSGDKSKTTLMIEGFKRYLENRIDIPIVFQNEFGSTKKANMIMSEVGISNKKKKNNKDKLAAIIILQDYLDRTQND